MKNAPTSSEFGQGAEVAPSATVAVTQEADVAAQMEAATTPDEAIQTLTSVPVGRTRKGSNSRSRSVPGVTRRKPPQNAKSSKWGVAPTENSVNVGAVDDTEQVTQQLGDTVEADEPLSVTELSGAGFADGIELSEERDDTANEVTNDVPATKTTVYKRADLEVPTDPRERAQAVADTYKRKKGPIVRQPALQQKAEDSNTQSDTAKSDVEAVDDATSNVQKIEGVGNVDEVNKFDEGRDASAKRWNEAMAGRKAEDPSIDEQMAEAMPKNSVSIGEALKEDLGLAAIQAGMLKDELRAIPGFILAGIGRKLNAAGEGTREGYAQHLSKREMAQYQRPLTQAEIDAKIAEKVSAKYAAAPGGASDAEVKAAIRERVNRVKAEVGVMVAKAKEKIDPRDPRFPSKGDIRDQNEYAREKSGSIEGALLAGTAYLEPIHRNTGNPNRKGEILSYQVSYTDGSRPRQLEVAQGETLLKTQQAGERIQSLIGLERARELMDRDLALVEVTRFGKVVIRDAVTNELIMDEQGEPLQMTQEELMDNDFFGVAFADEGEAIKLTKKEIKQHEQGSVGESMAVEAPDGAELPIPISVSIEPAETVLASEEAGLELQASSEIQALERAREADTRLKNVTVGQVAQSALLMNQLVTQRLTVEQFIQQQFNQLDNSENKEGAITYIDQWLDDVESEIKRVGGDVTASESVQEEVTEGTITERLEELFAGLEDEAGDLESMSNESLTKFIAMTEQMVVDIEEIGAQLEQNNAELYARLSQTIEATIQFIEDKRADAQELLDDPDRAAAAETADEAEQVTDKIVNKVAEAIQEFQSGEFDDATYNELFKEVADSKELSIGEQLQLMFQLLSAFINAISKPAA